MLLDKPKYLDTNMTQDVFHDWFSVKTLCRG